MPQLSEKENYFRMLRGEMPEYVPTWVFGMPMGPEGLGTLVGGFEGVQKDMFGVPYVTERLANCGALPVPGEFILEDISKWRDVIKRPAILDEIDWQLCADRDLPNWDPETLKSTMVGVGNGYFMLLTSFMGFDNGLVACMEEPEEVKDLLNFILELNLEISKKYIHYYHPETFMFADDIAHERAPFVSDEVFLDIFAPMWRANAEPFQEDGCFIEHHNCGMFSPFVKYIVEMGWHAWNPAEAMNDLVAVKKAFPGKMAIVGGFDARGFVCYPETTEEQIRAEVKRTLDMLAPGGGYAFGGFLMSAPDDEEFQKRNGWIQDEFQKLRYDYYE